MPATGAGLDRDWTGWLSPFRGLTDYGHADSGGSDALEVRLAEQPIRAHEEHCDQHEVRRDVAEAAAQERIDVAGGEALISA